MLSFALFILQLAFIGSMSCLGDESVETFHLYETFDISSLLTGDEDWWGILYVRQTLDDPGLTFYEDKVALKRWLMSIGVPIPTPFALNYASELEITSLRNEQSILDLLPQDGKDFVAKPSHKAESYNVWMVSPQADRVLVSKNGQKFIERKDFHPREVAENLADCFHQRPDDWESVALLSVKPGLVVEERITAFDRGSTRCDVEEEPGALEFKFFVIWGRVWVAQWMCTVWKLKWEPWFIMDPGFVYRNGTMVTGSKLTSIPKWVNWSRLVEIAERLGEHKDMLRIDIFAGVPAGSPSLRPQSTQQERQDAVKYVVSELEFFPASLFNDELLKEGADLWHEGYKSGNFRVIPNHEIPSEYFEAGFLPQTFGREMTEDSLGGLMVA